MSDDAFVILADESADWEIAGLPQLERLRRALQESFGDFPTVVWRPAEPAPDSSARVLSTHLFVHRKSLGDFLETAPVTTFDPAASWEEVSSDFARSCPVGERWRYVASPNDIPVAEDEFLRRTGKPQDGVVSRFINRPLTRPITRRLLHTNITPTGWTLFIFVLPVLAADFLWQGGYFSILLGTLIYQLYSMLDGCDGEIARAKFLESERGGRIDDVCDIVGALLFVIALGAGLGGAYFIEGITLAAMIATNEWLLHQPASNQPVKASTEAAYPRHRRLLEAVSRSPLGKRIAWCILQATKRDVGILLFVFLALLGLPQWILHPWLAVTLTTLSLNVVLLLRQRA